MLKRCTLCVLLCTSLIAIKAEESVYEEQNAAGSRPVASNAIIKLRNNIYTISYKKSILEFSIQPKGTVCGITLDEHDYFQGRIQSSAMDNGNIIVWGTKDIVKSIPKTRIFYSFMVINLRKCRVEKIFELADEAVDQEIINPTVIAYGRTFDVLLSSRQSCYPCRFDHKGNQCDSDDHINQFPPPPAGVHPFYFICTVPMDKDEEVRTAENTKYFFAYNNFENDQSVVRILPGFNSEWKDSTFDNPIYAFAVNEDIDQVIGWCFKKSASDVNFSDKIICGSLLNGEFRWTKRLPTEATRASSLEISNLLIDRSGSLYLTLEAQRDLIDTQLFETDAIVYHLDRMNGAAAKKDFHLRADNRFTEIYSFFRGENEFCLAGTVENANNVSLDSQCRNINVFEEVRTNSNPTYEIRHVTYL